MLCHVCRYTLQNLWRPENRVNHVCQEPGEDSLEISKHWCVHHRDGASWERSCREGCALCMKLGCTCPESDGGGKPCSFSVCRRRGDPKLLSLWFEGPEHAEVFSAVRVSEETDRMKLQLRWPGGQALSVSLVPLQCMFLSYSY